MKVILIYNDINSIFLSKSICTQLYKYLTKNTKKENEKLFLTINANITNNLSFTLIKNMSLDVSNYNNIFVILEDKLNMQLNRNYINFITFTYEVKDTKKKYIFTEIYYISFFILLVLLFGSFYSDIINMISYKEPLCDIVINNNINNNKPNKCLLNIFIELFKVNDSSYMHYPSYFMYNNVRYDIKPETLSIIEHVRHEQYVTINDLIGITQDNLEALQKIKIEYSDIIMST